MSDAAPTNYDNIPDKDWLDGKIDESQRFIPPSDPEERDDNVTNLRERERPIEGPRMSTEAKAALLRRLSAGDESSKGN